MFFVYFLLGCAKGKLFNPEPDFIREMSDKKITGQPGSGRSVICMLCFVWLFGASLKGILPKKTEEKKRRKEHGIKSGGIPLFLSLYRGSSVILDLKVPAVHGNPIITQ